MWRFLAVCLVLSLTRLAMAEPASPPMIEYFRQDAVPLLQAGEDAVSIRFSWKTTGRNCQLILDEQQIDVSSVTTATVNIPETMDVYLRCGTAEAHAHIPVRKKLSIVSLTVATMPEGKMIRWEAFGAISCRIQDRARQLDVRDQAAKGQYLLKGAMALFPIQLSCNDAQGLMASARFSELRRLNRQPNLSYLLQMNRTLDIFPAMAHEKP